MKKSIFALIFVIAGFGFSQASGLCEDRLFDASTSGEEGVSVGDLLGQLASECGYSMLVKDNVAKVKLAQGVASINIRGLPIEKIFDLVLTDNELSYEFDGSLLKISFLMTETFKINYIGTSRAGASNTDIILSQNANTSTDTNTSSELSGSGLQTNSNIANLDASVHQSLVDTGLQGGTVDSISGAKIMSMDQFDFWGRIEREIFEIAFRPGDSYIPAGSSSSGLGSGSGGEGASGGNSADTAVDDALAEVASKFKGQSVIVNKMAGLVTVTGTIKQIERVRKYIRELEDQMQNQVMIDVNILTVTHSDSDTVGVDWNQLWNFSNLLVPQFSTDNEDYISGFGSGQSYRIFASGVELTRFVEFLSSYGTVRSVSNPKVLTLNNQPAIISVGSILRYLQSSTYQTTSSGGSSTSSSDSYPTVFAGVLLDVTPSVQGDHIMLKINPSVTSTKDTDVENEATALDQPPNLSTNQLSSLVRVRDGDRVVLGGLISKSYNRSVNRIPILGYIPILKYLFSYDGTTEITTEMIIVITPHIVKRSSDNPSLQDLGYSETVNAVIQTGDIKAKADESIEEDKNRDLE